MFRENIALDPDPEPGPFSNLNQGKISHLENNVEPTTQLIGRQSHDLMKGILEKRGPRHRQLDVGGEGVGLAQVPELVQLPPEGALVLRGHAVGPLGPAARGSGAAAGSAAGSRVLEGSGAGVVVHKIPHSVLCVPVQGHCFLFLVFFFYFFQYLLYGIQHCFVCRSTDSTVSEDNTIAPRTVVIFQLAARRSDN